MLALVAVFFQVISLRRNSLCSEKKKIRHKIMHACEYDSAFFPLKLVTSEEDRSLNLVLNIEGSISAKYFEIHE